MAACAPGNDLRQGSLAGTWRAEKNERLNAIGLNGPPKKLAWAKNVGLSGKFRQVPRAHSSR
jgi:hypothetical protein